MVSRWLEGGAQGGSAIGVAVNGSAQVTMTATVIRELGGGNAGSYASWPYSCDGRGGGATAIQTSGDGHLTVSNSQITDLTGGRAVLCTLRLLRGGGRRGRWRPGDRRNDCRPRQPVLWISRTTCAWE